MAETTENPYAGWSDDRLIGTASVTGAAQGAMVAEMTRRHKQASADLGNKIWWLNFWLLVATVAILVLTGVLVWTALREMLR